MGPPIGSYLFSAGGFPLPLFTFGVALIATAIVATITIPSLTHTLSFKSSSDEKPISNEEYLNVLKLPETILAVACTALNVTTDVFVLINLEDHLKSFDLTMVQVGFVYLCLFLSYGISSPAAGKLGDKTDRELLLQGIGCLCISGLLTRACRSHANLPLCRGFHADCTSGCLLRSQRACHRRRSPTEGIGRWAAYLLLVYCLPESSPRCRQSRRLAYLHPDLDHRHLFHSDGVRGLLTAQTTSNVFSYVQQFTGRHFRTYHVRQDGDQSLGHYFHHCVHRTGDRLCPSRLLVSCAKAQTTETFTQKHQIRAFDPLSLRIH